MASPIATSLALTINRRDREIYNNIFRSNPTMAKIIEAKASRPWGGGGYNLEANIEKSINTSFGWADYKAQQALVENDPILTGTLPAKYIQGNMTWFKADETANVGPEKIADFVNTKVENAIASAKNALGLGIWQDGSGTMPHGLPAMLSMGGMFQSDGKTSNPNYGVFSANSYMGIDRSQSTNAFWMPRVGTSYTVDNGDGTIDTFGPYNTVEPLSLEAGNDGGVQKLYFDCCDNGGFDAPDLVITTLANYNKLHSFMSSLGQVQANQEMVDLGFPENFRYHAATVVWDMRCPANTLIFLNTKYVKIRPWAGYDEKFQTGQAESLAAIGVQGSTMLMEWAGNFQCTRPGRIGALSGKS
jgi:hypothetical protein